MFEVNDMVLYGSQGICRVHDVTTIEVQDEEIEYYILLPIHRDNDKIFVPTKNEKLTSKMRKILTKEEVYKLISEFPNTEALWIEDRNERREQFKKIIERGKSKEIAGIIKALYANKMERILEKKKPYIADERFLKEAEKLLYDEFAYALSVDSSEVNDIIKRELEKLD